MKLAVCIFAALSLPASAVAFECPWGEQGRLVPVRWSAEAGPSGTEVRIGIENTIDKQIRMVDGGLWFVDPLGRVVGDMGLEIDPDFQITALGANIATLTATGVDRLIGAKFEDFTPHICTRALLFTDGTKAEY